MTKTKLLGLEKEKNIVEYAIKHNLPVLLIGETGTGKTSMIRELAAQHERNFRRLNLNGNTGVEEFVGKMTLDATEEGGTVTKWQDGILLDAMKKGEWLLVDEINAALPEVLFVLQSLLDDDRYIVVADNNGEIVRPHKDFRLFAAMNPPAEYAGTKKLNKALLSRFSIVVNIPTPDKKLMQKIVVEHVPEIEAKINETVCTMAEHINMANEEGSTSFFCSVRDVISFAKLVASGHDTDTAFRLTILNKVDEGEEQAVTNVASLYFSLSDKKGRTIQSFEEKEKQLMEQLSNEMIDRLLAVDRDNFEHIVKTGYSKLWNELKTLNEGGKFSKTSIDTVRKILLNINFGELMDATIDTDKAKAVYKRHIDEVYQQLKQKN